MTRNAGRVERALARIGEQLAEFTRHDLALQTAYEVLKAATPTGHNSPVVILLTDGLPNRVPAAEDGQVTTTILRKADALKGLGATIYTIGFGEPGDVDDDLLKSVATRPDLYYYAPGEDDLDRIFQVISEGLRCPIPVWP